MTLLNHLPGHPLLKPIEAAARPALAVPLVLLIDGLTLTRECLAHALRQQTGDFLLHSVASPEQAQGDPPDAVLLNIHAARVDDAAVTARIADIAARFDGASLLVIAELDDGRLAVEAIRRGARGYLPTSLNAQLLAAAIGLVLAGGTFVPQRLIADCTAATSPRVAPAGRYGLTRREVEVLALLRQGKPNKLIAYELAISQSTVKIYVRSIMRKLHATNRTQLAVLTWPLPAGPADRAGSPVA